MLPSRSQKDADGRALRTIVETKTRADNGGAQGTRDDCFWSCHTDADALTTGIYTYALLHSLTLPPTTAVPDAYGDNLAAPTSEHMSLEVIVDRTASENKLLTSTLIE